MAPPKSRVHEDSRTETLPARERNGATHAGNASRSRRAANQQASGNATNSRTNAVSGHGGANANIANGEGAATLSEGSKISWISEDHNLLQVYRNVYRVNSPSAFKMPLSHVILGNSMIGRQSPTMARPKTKRRVSKEQLALTIRRNFNALAVNENDVVANLLYTVRSQDTPFRARFAPSRIK